MPAKEPSKVSMSNTKERVKVVKSETAFQRLMAPTWGQLRALVYLALAILSTAITVGEVQSAHHEKALEESRKYTDQQVNALRREMDGMARGINTRLDGIGTDVREIRSILLKRN